MWVLVLLLTSFFQGGVSGAVTTVTGFRGKSVQIKCPYDSGYESNTKYLCRGECSTLTFTSKDIPVQSGSPPKDQRFSLTDNTTHRVFTITITHLRPEDGGTYWCGIERSILDDYTKILLKVKTDDSTPTTVVTSTTVFLSTRPTTTQSTDATINQTSTTSHPITTTTTTTRTTSTSLPISSTESVIYIGSTFAIVVIVLLVAILVLYQQRGTAKKPKGAVEMTCVSTMPANPGEDEQIYHEIEDTEQTSDMGFKVKTIYSTANGPADAVVYTTVKEPAETDLYCNASPHLQISTNAHKSTAETVYSTVNILQ